MVARLLRVQIEFSPIPRVLSNTRRKSFTRDQVEMMLADLLHEQEFQRIRFRVGGRSVKSVADLFQLLAALNEMKNNVLDVGHRRTHLARPHDFSAGPLADVPELAGLTIDGVAPFGKAPSNPRSRLGSPKPCVRLHGCYGLG